MRHVARLGGLGLVVLVFASGVRAEDAARGGTRVEREDVERVADAEKAARTGVAVARMRDILIRVIDHLKDARGDKDMVKLACVNDKLTNVKGLLKISEQADVTMQEAIARRDVDTAEHEFEKIMIAQQKTEQLQVESEACVGALAVYAGDTQVDLELENVPEDDPVADVNTDPALPESVTRPDAASPYQ